MHSDKSMKMEPTKDSGVLPKLLARSERSRSSSMEYTAASTSFRQASNLSPQHHPFNTFSPSAKCALDSPPKVGRSSSCRTNGSKSFFNPCSYRDPASVSRDDEDSQDKRYCSISARARSNSPSPSTIPSRPPRLTPPNLSLAQKDALQEVAPAPMRGSNLMTQVTSPTGYFCNASSKQLEDAQGLVYQKPDQSASTSSTSTSHPGAGNYHADQHAQCADSIYSVQHTQGHTDPSETTTSPTKPCPSPITIKSSKSIILAGSDAADPSKKGRGGLTVCTGSVDTEESIDGTGWSTPYGLCIRAEELATPDKCFMDGVFSRLASTSKDVRRAFFERLLEEATPMDKTYLRTRLFAGMSELQIAQVKKLADCFSAIDGMMEGHDMASDVVPAIGVDGPSIEMESSAAQLAAKNARVKESNSLLLGLGRSLASRPLELSELTAHIRNSHSPPAIPNAPGTARFALKFDILTSLPLELAVRILQLLDARSVCRGAQVCRRWRQLADHDAVWRFLCEQHLDHKCQKCGWGIPSLMLSCVMPANSMKERLFEGRCPGPPESTAGNKWAPQRGQANAATAAKIGRHISSDQSTNSPTVTPEASLSPAAPSETAMASQGSVPTSPQDRGKSQNPTMVGVCKKIKTWKQIYCYRYNIERSWRTGSYKVRSFTGHTGAVLALQYRDAVLMTASSDRTVKIWCMHFGILMNTLEGHAAPVQCLQFDDTKLVTGSLDATIKFWCYRKGVVLKTLHSGTGGVLSLKFDNRYLVCGTASGALPIWDFMARECWTLHGHTDWVTSVQLHMNDTVISASDDSTVRIWDLKNRACTAILNQHTAQVSSVMPTSQLPGSRWKERAVSQHDHINNAADGLQTPYTKRHQQGGDSDVRYSEEHMDLDDSISSSSNRAPMIPVETFDELGRAHPDVGLSAPMGNRGGPHSLPPPQVPSDNLSSMPQLTCHHDRLHSLRDYIAPTPLADSSLLVSGSYDHTIRVWDMSKPASLRQLFGHVDAVTCLHFDHFRLASGSHDGTLRLWDLDDGKELFEVRNAHRGSINAVQVGDFRMVTAGEDGVVKMWTFGL